MARHADCRAVGIAELKFAGALALFVGVAGFSGWDLTRPGTDGEGSSLAKLGKVLSGEPQGPRTFCEPEEPLEKFQSEHVADFKAKVGEWHGNRQLIKVVHFNKGDNMVPGEKPCPCPEPGWYYMSRTRTTLPCGRISETSDFQFCGLSSMWDTKY